MLKEKKRSRNYKEGKKEEKGECVRNGDQKIESEKEKRW